MTRPDWTPCTSCGACCTDIGHIKDLSDLGFVLPDGSCKNLDRETKGCRIYASRPTVCNVEAIRPPMLSEEAWSMLTVAACDFLHRREYGVEREDKGPCQHKMGGKTDTPVITSLLSDWECWLRSLARFCSIPRPGNGPTRPGERCPCGAVGPHDEQEGP